MSTDLIAAPIDEVSMDDTLNVIALGDARAMTLKQHFSRHMTTHGRRQATSYSSEDERPQGISEEERADIERWLTVFAKCEPRRNKFFAVRFPTTSAAKHYVVFTEKFSDFRTVFVWADGSVQLSAMLGEPAPDGANLVSPKVIIDADWDKLAREPYFRDAFHDARSKHGRKLAEAMQGAHFDGGPELGDVFVVTRELAKEVDIFVRAPGMPLRHVLCAECVLAA